MIYISLPKFSNPADWDNPTKLVITSSALKSKIAKYPFAELMFLSEIIDVLSSFERSRMSQPTIHSIRLLLEEASIRLILKFIFILYSFKASEAENFFKIELCFFWGFKEGKRCLVKMMTQQHFLPPYYRLPILLSSRVTEPLRPISTKIFCSMCC